MGMVWLAKNDTSFPALNGLIQAPSTTAVFSTTPSSGLLECGSIIVEATIDQENYTPVALLQCTISGQTNSQLCLTIDKDGNTNAHLQLGDAVCQLNISGDTALTQTQIRITFSWNMQNKTALLSVENPKTGLLCQTETSTPLPMPIEIMNTLLAQRPPACVSPNITFLGVSNQIEPVGFMPSIGKHSLVKTPTGAQPIETLLCGDLVETADNGPQPIRWICERTVPTKGLFQPLRLRAPYFGLLQDILVSPEQRIVFESPETEYLFGVESVLVEARHLVNNVNVIREPSIDDNIHLFQLLFDSHEIITVSGAQMESLFIGKIADDPDMIKSTLLAGLLPENVPYHKCIARPLLRSYEAMALQNDMYH